MKLRKAKEPQTVTACTVQRPCRRTWAYGRMRYKSSWTGGLSALMMVRTHQRSRKPQDRRGRTSSHHFLDGRHHPRLRKCPPPPTPAEAIRQIIHPFRRRCCPRHTAIFPKSLTPRRLTCPKPMATCEHPTSPTPVSLSRRKPARPRPRLPRWTRSCGK